MRIILWALGQIMKSHVQQIGVWRWVLGVCPKCSTIRAGWQDLRLDSIQLTSQLSVFSKIRYKKYWLHANVVSPSMVQYILLQLLLQVCTSGFPVQWLRSSFPHEQIRFDLAALQFKKGNEKIILFLKESNKGNVMAMQIQLSTKHLNCISCIQGTSSIIQEVCISVK